jgi:hypothetical protein
MVRPGIGSGVKAQKMFKHLRRSVYSRISPGAGRELNVIGGLEGLLSKVRDGHTLIVQT